MNIISNSILPRLPWGFGSSPLPAQELERALFSKGPALPEQGTAVSSHSFNSTFVTGDTLSLFRSAQSLVATGICQADHAGKWLEGIFLGQGASVGFNAFGISTALYSFLGPCAIFRDFRAAQLADAIEDRQGSLLARLSIFKSSLLTAGGLSFAIYRPLAVAAAIKGVAIETLSSGPTLARGAFGALAIGSASFIAMFGVIATMVGIQLYDAVSFRRELNKCSTPQEKIELLRKAATVNPQEVLEKLILKHVNKGESQESAEVKARQELAQEALSAGMKEMKTTLKELGIKSPSDEALKFAVYQATEKATSTPWFGKKEVVVLEKLTATGLAMRMVKEEKKNWAKLNRMLGKEGIEAVKSLQGRAKVGAVEGEELLSRVESSIGKEVKIKSFIIGVSIAMALFIGLSFGHFALPILIFVAMASLLSTAAMGGIDLYFLLQSYQNEMAQKGDKRFLAISTALAIGTFATVVALHVAGVFTMGVLPLVVATVMMGIWLAQNGITYAVIRRKEEKELLQHPTLESFAKTASRGLSEFQIAQVFEKLPEEAKREIRACKNWGDSFAIAAQKAVEKGGMARRRHLERLREAIVPLLVN